MYFLNSVSFIIHSTATSPRHIPLFTLPSIQDFGLCLGLNTTYLPYNSSTFKDSLEKSLISILLSLLKSSKWFRV